jgi:hypothetical protein
MPSSNFEGFDVQVEDEAGVITNVGAGVNVIAYSVAGSSDCDIFTTDSDGHIASGTVSASVGDRIHFRVDSYNGKSASVSQITT